MGLVEGLVTEEEKATGRVVLATRMGLPAQQILEYAREHGAVDLIVIGTSGRGGVMRLMTGRVSDKIVRSAPCPVLTVHPHDREEPTPSDRAA